MGGTYHDLRAWQNAMELTVKIYRATRKFPHEEMYGLSSQLRRAAVSLYRATSLKARAARLTRNLCSS